MIEYTMEGRIARVGVRRTDIRLGVSFQWDPDEDPISISMICTWEEDDGDQMVVWKFSFELLELGCRSATPVGQGDVKLKSIGDRFLVCLKNPDGHADLSLPHREVRLFADEVEKALDGAEVDECISSRLDAFLEEVLGS